jgi:uncharacterized protein YciI
MLIMTAANRAALEKLIAGAPFATQGLTTNMTVRAWGLIFGAFRTKCVKSESPPSF